MPCVCDCHPTEPAPTTAVALLTRRGVVAAVAAAATLTPLVAGLFGGQAAASVIARQPGLPPVEVAASPDAVEVLPGLWIRPREAWGDDLPPKGPVVAEDARFLLVHHTASASNYSSARQVIRNVYSFQTRSEERRVGKEC